MSADSNKRKAEDEPEGSVHEPKKAKQEASLTEEEKKEAKLQQRKKEAYANVNQDGHFHQWYTGMKILVDEFELEHKFIITPLLKRFVARKTGDSLSRIQALFSNITDKNKEIFLHAFNEFIAESNEFKSSIRSAETFYIDLLQPFMMGAGFLQNNNIQQFMTQYYKTKLCERPPSFELRADASLKLAKLQSINLLPTILTECLTNLGYSDFSQDQLIRALKQFYDFAPGICLENISAFLQYEYPDSQEKQYGKENSYTTLLANFFNQFLKEDQIGKLLSTIYLSENGLPLFLKFYDSSPEKWQPVCIQYLKSKESTPKYREFVGKALERRGVLVFGNLVSRGKEFKSNKVVVVNENQVQQQLAYSYRNHYLNWSEETAREYEGRNKLIAQFCFILTYEHKDVKRREQIHIPVKIPGKDFYFYEEAKGQPLLQCKKNHSETAFYFALLLNMNNVLGDIKEKIPQYLLRKINSNRGGDHKPLTQADISISSLKVIILEIYSTFIACKDCFELITQGLLFKVEFRRNLHFGYTTPQNNDLKEDVDKGIATSIYYSYGEGASNLGNLYKAGISKNGCDYNVPLWDETSRTARKAFYSNGVFQQHLLKTPEKCDLEEYTIFISNGKG